MSFKEKKERKKKKKLAQLRMLFHLDLLVLKLIFLLEKFRNARLRGISRRPHDNIHTLVQNNYVCTQTLQL